MFQRIRADRSPSPKAWEIENKAGPGKVKSKKPFPLFNTPDYGGRMTNSLAELH